MRSKPPARTTLPDDPALRARIREQLVARIDTTGGTADPTYAATGCHRWTGSLNTSNKPVLKVRELGPNEIAARRLLWILERGPIPEGKLVVAECYRERGIARGRAHCMTLAHLVLSDAASGYGR